ncbi:MAG: OmpH family outer membrane protein [Elusimicrobia bacterium]|nr:OmpH family outer membrane protein [Elusimicrobiota bacterium]
MVKLSLLAMLAVSFFCAQAFAAPRGSVVVFADMDAIFEAHPQTQTSRESLRAKAQTRKEAIELKIARLERRLAEGDSADETAAVSARRGSRRGAGSSGDGAYTDESIYGLKTQIAQKSASVRAEIQEMESRASREILTDIEAAIRRVATANNYSIVLDRNQVVYADSSLDITDTVIRNLSAR